jgi:hypothetical protein
MSSTSFSLLMGGIEIIMCIAADRHPVQLDGDSSREKRRL